MTGYVPPALRNISSYKPKKLSLKPKPVDWTQLKTKEELYKDYEKENHGKADSSWDSDSNNNITSKQKNTSYFNNNKNEKTYGSRTLELCFI